MRLIQQFTNKRKSNRNSHNLVVAVKEIKSVALVTEIHEKIEIWLLVLPTLFCLLSVQAVGSTIERNGFVIEGPLIPVNEIYSGGPARDGIPSLDKPVFIRAHEAEFLIPSDKLIGVSLNGIEKAFPIAILNYHELVNDYFGRQSITISYCPLCGTGMAFNAKVKGDPLVFGVSGLLYNNDMLMYDRKTHSLWSQIKGRAISGPLKGEYLQQVPVEHTTWRAWRERYPETLVLSNKTGFRRNYGSDPYPHYENSSRLIFPLTDYDRRYSTKELVIGLRVGNKAKAYPFVELARGQAAVMEAFVFTDTVNGQTFTVEYHDKDKSARILDSSGHLVASVTAYWFAWMAFHPESEVYTFKDEKASD